MGRDFIRSMRSRTVMVSPLMDWFCFHSSW